MYISVLNHPIALKTRCVLLRERERESRHRKCLIVLKEGFLFHGERIFILNFGVQKQASMIYPAFIDSLKTVLITTKWLLETRQRVYS